MANDKIDWSQYEVKDDGDKIDWSQFEVKDDDQESYIEPLSNSDRSGYIGVPLPPEEKVNKGFSGIRDDATDMLANLLGKAFNVPDFIDKEAPAAYKMLGEKPGRAWKQLASGALSLGKNIINTPHDITQYIASKEILPEPLNKAYKFASDITPHIPEDTGLEKAAGLDNLEPGDEILKALPAALAGGAGIKQLAEGGLKALKQPGKDRRIRREIEDNISSAAKDAGLSVEQTKKLQEALTEQFHKNFEGTAGEMTPSGQQVSIYKKEHKANKLEADRNIPEQQVGEIPEAPDTKSKIDALKTNAEEARKDLMVKSLKVKENPELRAGEKIQSSITNLRKASSDLYTKAREILVGKNVRANNGKEIKEVTKDLNALIEADELAPGYGSGTAEQKALIEKIRSLEGETVNASDVLDLQRTIEKMAKDTRVKQHSGVSDMEYTRLGKQAENLDVRANSLAKQLESVGGKEVQSLIKEANKGWKVYKDVTGYNETGKRAYYKGDITSSTLNNIARNETGNDFLRALMDKHPDLRRQVLASHVGESTDILGGKLGATAEVKKYLEHPDMGEVNTKLQAFQTALSKIKEGQSSAAIEKKHYKELKQSMTEAAKQQQNRVNAIKEHEDLTKQIKFHESAIPKLEKQIKVAESKGEKVDQLRKDLIKHKRDVQDKNNRLKKLIQSGLKITGVTALGHKAGL